MSVTREGTPVPREGADVAVQLLGPEGSRPTWLNVFDWSARSDFGPPTEDWSFLGVLWGHLPSATNVGSPRLVPGNPDGRLESAFWSGRIEEGVYVPWSISVPWPRVYRFEGCLACTGDGSATMLVRDPAQGLNYVRTNTWDVRLSLPVTPKADQVLADPSGTWVAPVEARDRWLPDTPNAVVLDLGTLSARGSLTDTGGTLLARYYPQNNLLAAGRTGVERGVRTTALATLTGTERARISRPPRRLRITPRRVEVPSTRFRGERARRAGAGVASELTASASLSGGGSNPWLSVAWSLATYGGSTGEVYVVAAGIPKVYRYHALSDTWTTTVLNASLVPESLLAVTWRSVDRAVYALGTTTNANQETSIHLLRYGLDDASLTVRATWTATGASSGYSLGALPDGRLLLFGSIAWAPYVGGFVLDPDATPVVATSEVWAYGSLAPYAPAHADTTTASWFASDAGVGSYPAGMPWSWWYPAWPGDLNWLF